MAVRWIIYPKSGNQLGPMSGDEVRVALRSGDVDPFDFVARAGSNSRIELVEVDEIFVGGEKHDGKRGRGASGKALVLMIVQREEKNWGAYV